jgi:hypothetical protein
VVVVVPDVDPSVLGRNECAGQHGAEDDYRGQCVEARGLPRDRSPFGRQDVAHGAAQRPSEIDQDVQAEEHEPDDRCRTMEPAGELEGVSVQEAHRHAAPEEHDCRCDEQRREQSHGDLRRTVFHVGPTARVVAGEPPAGGRQLQDDRRDKGEPHEDVPRHEAVDSEQDGRDLDEDRSEQKHSHRRRQTLVPVGVHARLPERN